MSEKPEKPDTSMAALTRTINEVGKAFGAFKETNDERLEALKAGDEGRAAELNAKLEKIEKDLSQFTALKKQIELEQQAHRERIEELETRASSPSRTPSQKRASEYKDAFVAWLRNKGTSPLDEQKLQTLTKEMTIRGDVTIGTGAAGGFAVPEEISREIGRLELLFSPVRSLVKVVQVGTADYKALVSKRGTTSGWVGEAGTRSATLTPQLRERAPTFGELYAYPQASEWSLDDIFFNVETWLAEEVAQEFAQEEGIAVISGNGTSKPTGMINTAPVATADFASPERSANAFQLVTSDLTPGGVGVLADSLIDLAATLNTAYLSRATWVMNSLTSASIRKLKETTNQYIWQPGLQAGTPDMLLGRPVAIWENMPAVGANNFPVAIGDWQRAYVLADRVGLRITRDNVTNVGFVRFYVRRREGGHVLDNHAAKWLQTL
jgi:HK97 family phage major capsid protein